MTFRRLMLWGLTCLAVACAKSPAAGSGGVNDPCLTNADCKAPLICTAPNWAKTKAAADNTAVERCELDQNAVCDKGKERCNGLAIETCDPQSDAGDGIHGNVWKVTQTCTTRCDWVKETQTATCAAQVCTPGATECFPTSDSTSPTIIQQCDARGTAWVDAQVCPTSCVMANGQAECSTPVCTPFAHRCNPSGQTRQQCDSEGTAWRDESCPDNTTCSGGTCLPVVCTPGDEKCDETGTTVVSCNDAGTAYVAKEVCQNGCVFDTGTKTASCPAAVCSPWATQCDPANLDQVQQCNELGTAWVDQAIPSGQKCVDGEYVPKVCSYHAVTSGGTTTVTADTRCAGTVLEQCDPQENGWDALELCQYGCGQDSNGNPACAPALCAQGQSTCGGADQSALEACDKNGVSWDFIQYCPAGCAVDETKTPPVASCEPTSCTPFSTQCGTDPATGIQYVELCQPDGSKFVRTDDCAQSCVDGNCAVLDAQCPTSGPASQRCEGEEVERCELLSNGATEWRFSERCLGACESGACTAGGSAGCAGGALPTTICGAPDRQVVDLHPLLAPDAVTKVLPVVPCDGVSRVLVYSDPIVSAAGVAVPDGTLVTFSLSGTSANLLASQDADPALPGLQRPTLFGRAAVLLQAPASCSGPTTITVEASLGGRATGAVGVQFGPSQSSLSRDVYVAEDFSRPTYDDPSATDAQWNTSIGAAVALAPYDFGTGGDGDYDATVDQKTGKGVHSLDEEGFAPSWDVSRMGPESVYVSVSDAAGRAPSTLAPGDEVLLLTLWSAAGDTIGTWELHRVVSTAFRADIGQWEIGLSTPIEHVFGDGGANLDFTSNRTVIQRVPNFLNFTVEPSASVTVDAPTWSGSALGGGTGVLAFRVQGTLRVLGKIDLSGKGFPWGVSPTAPPSSATGRLVLGHGGRASGSYPGGGIALLSAKDLTFDDQSGNPADSSALITVAAGTPGLGLIPGAGAIIGPPIFPGTGGVVVAKSASIVFGSDPTAFPRFETGNQGRASLTYATVDDDPVTSTETPPPVDAQTSLTVRHAGAFNVQSTVAYQAGSSTPLNTIVTTTLEGVIGGEGGSSVVSPIPAGGLTGPLPMLTVQTTADGGTTYGDSDAGRVLYDGTTGTPKPPPPYRGSSFEWKAALTNLDDRPVYLSGLAFKLVLQ